MRYSCCQTVTDEGVRTSDRVRCQNEDTVQSFVVDSCCQTLTDEGVRTSDRVRCQTDDEMVPKLFLINSEKYVCLLVLLQKP